MGGQGALYLTYKHHPAHWEEIGIRHCRSQTRRLTGHTKDKGETVDYTKQTQPDDKKDETLQFCINNKFP